MTLDVIAAARRRTRRLAFIVAAAAVIICALAYPLVHYVTTRHHDNAATPPAAASATASPSAQAAAVVLPTDTTWTTVAGVALPSSATAGPLRRHHGLAAGFAHTPVGAMFAAVYLLVDTTPQVGSAVFEPTLHQQVVGEYATAMLDTVEADYRALGGDPATGLPIGVLPAAVAGARIITVSDTAARIDLLTVAVDATGTDRFAATTVDLVWTGTDWALVAPAAGRWDGVVTAVTPVQAALYPPLAPGR
jgi:hypothetical protein